MSGVCVIACGSNPEDGGSTAGSLVQCLHEGFHEGVHWAEEIEDEIVVIVGNYLDFKPSNSL